MSDNDNAPDPPLEFKILQVKAVGFAGSAWYHGDTKLGSGEELERILNHFGNEGWDVVQIVPVLHNGTPPWILLRRKAR